MKLVYLLAMSVVFNLSKIHNLKQFTTSIPQLKINIRCIQSFKDT